MQIKEVKIQVLHAWVISCFLAQFHEHSPTDLVENMQPVCPFTVYFCGLGKVSDRNELSGKTLLYTEDSHYRVIELVQLHWWVVGEGGRKRERDLNSASDSSCQFVQCAFAPEWTSLACSLTFVPAPTLFCFLWLLVQFAGGQLAEGKEGKAGCLFSLPTLVLIAVSLIHNFFQPP